MMLTNADGPNKGIEHGGMSGVMITDIYECKHKASVASDREHPPHTASQEPLAFEGSGRRRDGDSYG